EHVQRGQEQEQTTGHLEGGEADPKEIEDHTAAQGKEGDDEEEDRRRLARRLPALFGRVAPRQREEDRRESQGIDDEEERGERDQEETGRFNEHRGPRLPVRRRP